MDRTKYTITFTRHALKRADERDITMDMIEATIRGGIIKRFAKHNVKFARKYKNFTVLCIDKQ